MIQSTLSLLFVTVAGYSALGEVTINADRDAADGLDLQAVGQLLQNVDNAEHLERSLNNQDLGLNNLDLNLDGQVDYIRVLTHDQGETRVLVLQVPLSENDFQDIATIEIDKHRDQVVVQITGNEQVYGPSYYVHPVGIAWASVSFVNWLYGPQYRPWRSTVGLGVYPRWWRPWPRVRHHTYIGRTRAYTRSVFRVSTTNRVVRATTVYQAPHVSLRVKAPLRKPTEHQVKAGVKVSKTVRGSQRTLGVAHTKTKVTKSGSVKKSTTRSKTTATKTTKKTNTKKKSRGRKAQTKKVKKRN